METSSSHEDMLAEAAKEWLEIVYPKMAEVAGEHGLIHQAKENIDKSKLESRVTHEIGQAIDRGYRSTHKGSEIIEAISTWKQERLDHALEAIFSTMISQVEEKVQNKNGNIEDYLFILLSNENQEIEKQGFNALVSGDGKKLPFHEKDINNFISDKSLEYSESGLDTLSGYFFNTFYSDVYGRNPLLIPELEDLIKLEI